MPNLPSGAVQLPLNQISTVPNSGQVRDVSSQYWFSPLQPIAPTAPKDLRVRQWQFSPGANINWTPGSEDTPAVGFWILREVADSWDMLRIVIETVKDRLCSEQGEFRLIPAIGENKKDLKARTEKDKRLQQLTNFFKYPDGFHTWEQWLRMLLEDILVLDAGCVYLERDKKGRVASLRVIDGGTISRSITDQGFTPNQPDIAYQQVLYGLPAINLTQDDIIYTMRNPRAWKRYGFSPVEQVLVTISIGLSKQQYDLKYYTEGNIPEALCFLPPEMPIDKVTEVQSWYDSILAGDLGNRRRLTFLPGYGSPKDQAFRPNIVFTKNSEIMMKTAWDEWQLRTICNALGVSPALMVSPLNRATASANAEQAEEEGLEPKLHTVEAIINKIVQTKFGYDDIEFRYGQRRDVDIEKQMTVDTGYAKIGVRTLNEIRQELGEDPYDFAEANEPLAFLPTGVVPLTASIAASMAALQDGGDGQNGAGGNGNGKPKPPSKPTLPSKKVFLLNGETYLIEKQAPPTIKGGMTSPATEIAAAHIEGALQQVFRRQKERATQAVNELKKKVSFTTKVRKDNPYHVPAGSSSGGQFTSAETAGFQTFKLETGETLALSKDPDTRLAQLAAHQKAELEKLPPDVQQSLKDGKQTADIFSKNGQLTPERQVWHDNIVDSYMQGHEVQEEPKIIFVGGGSAAGKTSAAADAAEAVGDHVYVNVDQLRPKLPEFGALVPNNMGQMQDEVGSLRDDIIATAKERHYNIIIDGVGSGSAAQSVDQVTAAGYEGGYYYVHRPVEDALTRAAARPLMTNKIADLRNVPPDVVKEAHIKARSSFAALADTNREVKVYDKSDPSFGKNGKVVFWKTADGEIKTYDPVGVKRVEDGGTPKIHIYH